LHLIVQSFMSIRTADHSFCCKY